MKQSLSQTVLTCAIANVFANLDGFTAFIAFRLQCCCGICIRSVSMFGRMWSTISICDFPCLQTYGLQAVRESSSMSIQPSAFEVTELHETPNTPPPPPQQQTMELPAAPLTQSPLSRSTHSMRARRAMEPPPGRPPVMHIKMAATNTAAGQPCHVPSDLYAVLVTGVPKLDRRRY